MRDTGATSTNELAALMEDRAVWRNLGDVRRRLVGRYVVVVIVRAVVVVGVVY